MFLGVRINVADICSFLDFVSGGGGSRFLVTVLTDKNIRGMKPE